jgi:hypothetical protein
MLTWALNSYCLFNSSILVTFTIFHRLLLQTYLDQVHIRFYNFPESRSLSMKDLNSSVVLDILSSIFSLYLWSLYLSLFTISIILTHKLVALLMLVSYCSTKSSNSSFSVNNILSLPFLFFKCFLLFH